MMLTIALLLAATVEGPREPIKIDEIVALKIGKLEAEQRANDNELAALKVTIQLMQQRAQQLQVDSAEKKKQEAALVEKAFADAKLDKTKYKIDVEKQEFTKVEEEKK